ncbi:MAG: ribosome maturation factor RimP [Actinomyces sp.]|uniref:ribosome maturation factor RimP n=1 Tax=Actinomyces sp. TaxID=29317 RepID=UPI0026DD59CA|nr:ribosome maturation factor RimP [Actinomyces sp.]MDO4243918.1 ribosome maturation factor RimP [Actinomyces sp.]
MKDTLAPRLSELLVPVVEAAGLHLEFIETTSAGRYSTVRVVVDLVDGPGDLDLDSLTEVTRAVSSALDEADPVAGQFTLEVSTPGAERELSTARHFRRAVGHTVRVTTLQGEATGVVLGADDARLTLEVDGEPRTIDVEDVTAARMVAVL